jgi:hypothetical protein
MLTMHCTSFMDPFYAIDLLVLRLLEGWPCWAHGGRHHGAFDVTDLALDPADQLAGENLVGCPEASNCPNRHFWHNM